jgi:poly(3-hydroxybutyrate) depolymerase
MIPRPRQTLLDLPASSQPRPAMTDVRARSVTGHRRRRRTVRKEVETAVRCVILPALLLLGCDTPAALPVTDGAAVMDVMGVEVSAPPDRTTVGPTDASDVASSLPDIPAADDVAVDVAVARDTSTVDIVAAPDVGPLDAVTVADTAIVEDRPAPMDAPGSAGCGMAAAGGVRNGSLMVAGVRRTYVLSVPPGYDPSVPIPIVFGWHGNTWTGATFRPSIAVESSAMTSAIFVYPDGLDVTGLPADAAGGVTGTGWDWRRDGRDIALFDALLADLEARFCVDRTRRYSYGRSHGGFFAHALACARGDLLRASASVSAGAPSWVLSSPCARPLPVWMAHNADDRTVPVTLANQARDRWLSVNTCSTDTRPDGPCAGYVCTGADVQFCLSPNGDHAPPAFSGARIAAWFQSH